MYWAATLLCAKFLQCVSRSQFFFYYNPLILPKYHIHFLEFSLMLFFRFSNFFWSLTFPEYLIWCGMISLTRHLQFGKVYPGKLKGDLDPGSPVQYIDMTYRLSIYRHFRKISISISISIWSFLKISISILISIRQFQKYRYRYGDFGKYRYRYR